MKRSAVLFILLLTSIGSFAFAAYETPGSTTAAKDEPKMDGAVKTSSEAYNRIKGWAGKWEGTSSGHGPTEKSAVEYSVTSGGNAVEEKLFVGTPHEMVTLYYENKSGKVGLTHFCMLGNRPHMELKSSDASKLDFDWIAGGGVDPNELHMHSLSIVTTDKDHMTQTWTSYNNGKLQDTTVIALTRVS